MNFITRLRNVIAGNDIVGRDKITNNILPLPRQLDLLSESYKKEVEENKTTTSIIDELNHYKNKRTEIRDLTEKLTEAGFTDLIDEGEELKELVAKLIIKNQNYKSAQKIITYLLSEVESIFNSKIKHKLTDTDEINQVKLLIREHIEKEVGDKLGENVLEIFNRQISGMVFFLTGNCHLEWK